MKIPRNQKVLRIFSLLTAVIFLNMGFFLAEVCMLDLHDKQMIENVASLVLNGGLEEERDGHASSGADAPAKIFPLTDDAALLCHATLYLIATKIYHEGDDPYLQTDYSKIFSPPPETPGLS